MNEISNETLVEWYNLMEHYLEIIKYKFRNTNSISWLRMSQMSLSENFIKTFQGKVIWTYISGRLPLKEKFIREFQDQIDWEATSKHGNLSDNFIRQCRLKSIWKSI
jgi:hypothetical protein